MHCSRKYTPDPKHHGYPESVRQQARDMYMDGGKLRQIAQSLNVHHRTVSLWVNEQTHSLPKMPVLEEAKDVKMDKLLTYIGDKKISSTT